MKSMCAQRSFLPSTNPMLLRPTKSKSPGASRWCRRPGSGRRADILVDILVRSSVEETETWRNCAGSRRVRELLRTRMSARRCLLRALINPGADERHFVFGQRIAFSLWRHRVIFITNAGDVVEQRAFFTTAGNDVRTILAAFNRGLPAIEPEFALLLFRAMAFETGLFKDRLDVFFVSKAFFVRGRRQLAEIDFFGIGC